MVDLAKRRLSKVPGATERVAFYVGDVRRVTLPPRPYDAVVTNFFLDCFPEPDLGNVIARLAAVTTTGSKWVVGDFARPKSMWMKLPADPLLWAMYTFFRYTTGLQTRRLVDPTPLLRSHGFELILERASLGGFLSSQLWVR
jgi:hypothetical protein